jgi:nucleoside-diphosphate-sugar epimerase
VRDAAGAPPNITLGAKALGDVFRTGARIDRANQTLDWTPTVSMPEGVALQVQAATHP